MIHFLVIYYGGVVVGSTVILLAITVIDVEES